MSGTNVAMVTISYKIANDKRYTKAIQFKIKGL